MRTLCGKEVILLHRYHPWSAEIIFQLCESNHKRPVVEDDSEKEKGKRKRVEGESEVVEEHGRKRIRMSENTCKISACGRTCPKSEGTGWYGCEMCDIFWICNQCAKVSARKTTVLLHEKKCKKVN
tara:strand:- start:284 stop:661 length:378 start_codon:yes stop_codon:yes gene_type:complete